MSDVGAGVFAKRRVVPEDVVALSVFPFACFGWFVLQGVVVSTFIECFLVRRYIYIYLTGFSKRYLCRFSLENRRSLFSSYCAGLKPRGGSVKTWLDKL